MNFYAHQARVHRQSRLLLVLFALAVVGVLCLINLVVLTALASADSREFALPDGAWLATHLEQVAQISAVVLAIVLLSSLYKTAVLREGGGAVARGLGATRVERETQEPLQRRLYNVVEEMAIASGLPVPEVYVLEQEVGINAFAAGHSPANAAVAVTRGALETLNRAELQGVIAHEFSHILHGDVRLNMRLMSWLFGLFVIALVGRTVLRFSPRGLRGKRAGGGAVIVLVALAVTALGYAGVFFGRLLQAALSRQRELLADASAVQFTREPEGLKGALLKIGRSGLGSKLQETDGEEVAHMLFAVGTSRLFATHPPLIERLRALDPSIGEQALEGPLLERLPKGADGKVERAQPATPPSFAGSLAFAPGQISSLVGNAGAQEIEIAQTLIASLPAELSAELGDSAGALAMLIALVLDPAPEMRNRQLELVSQWWGLGVEQRVTRVAASLQGLPSFQRLPLLESLFPALRRLPQDHRRRLIENLERLILVDGKIEIFEYALASLTRHYLEAGLTPVATSHPLKLRQVVVELGTVFSTLAHHGTRDQAQAEESYRLGMSRVSPQEIPPYRPDPAWPKAVERALRSLERLRPTDKSLLVEGLVMTVSHDQQLTVNEVELLRVICARVGCPLPPLVAKVAEPAA